MPKTVTICFRTDEELKRSLEKIAKVERRSLSNVIDNILYDRVKGEENKDDR